MNTGINYQPQLVDRISFINSITNDCFFLELYILCVEILRRWNHWTIRGDPLRSHSTFEIHQHFVLPKFFFNQNTPPLITYATRKINMEPKHGGLVQMMFLFNWVTLMFHVIFRGVDYNSTTTLPAKKHLLPGSLT